MKNLLALTICIVLLASMPGIGVEAALPQAKPPQITTITIWHSLASEQLPAVQSVLTKYQQDNPNVEIVLHHFVDFSPELDAAFAAGTAPDLVWWANDVIGAAMDNNWIVDLGQLGIKSEWLDANYAPVAAQGVQLNGKIWGVPESMEAIALVYNKDVVGAQYLPTDPLDFAALYDKTAAFMADNQGQKTLICNQGFWGGDAYHVAPIYFGFGMPGYIDETGNVYANSSEAIAAGYWLASIKPLSQFWQDYDDCEAGLINGTVGMWWTGPWALADLNLAGLDYGILPMGKPFVGIKTLMVTTAAKQRGTAEAALDVAKFFTNTANAITLTETIGTIPANRAALKNPLVLKIPSVAGFSAAISQGVPMSPSSLSSCQWGPMGDAEAAIWWGGASVEDALNLAQSQMESCVSFMVGP